MAQGKVTQISGNEIVDNALRKILNINMSNSIDDINIKIEQLRIAIMAIGQMVTSICYAIENSDNNPIKTKYTNITGDTNIYANTKDNFYSIILQLSRGNLSSEYRKGGNRQNPTPSSAGRRNNANAICLNQYAAEYYYGTGLDSRIVDYIQQMNEKIAKSKGTYININTLTEDSNIF